MSEAFDISQFAINMGAFPKKGHERVEAPVGSLIVTFDESERAERSDGPTQMDGSFQSSPGTDEYA